MRPENGIEKIVYTAPFMSILEQNSQDFREISGAENFLEHHSNVVFDDSEEGEEELRDRKSTRLNSSHQPQSRMPSSA